LRVWVGFRGWGGAFSGGSNEALLLCSKGQIGIFRQVGVGQCTLLVRVRLAVEEKAGS
jgi:hypothetical protein